MGIPSYYKTLCDRIPGLLAKRIHQQPTHLWIDFNCMVYHCIRRPGMRSYEGEDTRHIWEGELIDQVCKYLKKIVSIVSPSKRVYVAVDGVVPMAKIRQQRLRRFKSIWTASEEEKLGIRSSSQPRWDTNAITPGTAFMERLSKALHQVSTGNQVEWSISAADEAGEGEQKLMRELQTTNTESSHCIYGLDADLIVLSMLQKRSSMWLFREAIECGEVLYNGSEEEYRYFSIDRLKEYLFKGQDESYLRDYCMGMSLLGNDFLPHSISVKLKDGGHDVLLQMLRSVRSEVGTLIDSESGLWKPNALQSCFEWLSRAEEDWIQNSISHKLKQRWQKTRGSTPQEHAADEMNKFPLRVAEDMALVGFGGSLRSDWKQVYHLRYLQTDSLNTICSEYCKGLQWICNYYTGNAMDTMWHFPWLVPPLWSDLHTWIQTQKEISPPQITGITLAPQEQLSIVLPIQSYWLVRDKKLRQLPNRLPQYWPSKFELFTLGRKHIWEAEAQIPILTPQRVRHVLATAT